MPGSSHGFAGIIIQHLVDIMAGRCTITQEVVEASADDPELCQILTGLLYVHEDLDMRNRQIAERTQELKRTVRELWAEMDLARKIQTVLLPSIGTLDGYDVASKMRPALEVGGDYYDIVPADAGGWVLIGDVSGHGLSAGLTMMMVQTAVRTLITCEPAAGRESRPSHMLAMLNKALRDNLRQLGGQPFVTLTACRLRGSKVIHAGLHQDIPVYRAATGTVELVETRGTWIGIDDDVSSALVDGTFELASGDTMLLYTDGLSEARRDGAYIGEEAVAEMFGTLAKQRLAPDALIQALEDSVADCELDDDLSLVVVRRR